MAEYGGLDVCYANAGVSGVVGAFGDIPLFDMTADHWTDLLRINLIGPFLAIKHASRAMLPQRARARSSAPRRWRACAPAPEPPYSASKAGVINLVQTCAQQLAGTGVRVNAICPGLIETGMTKAIYERARAIAAGRTASASSTRCAGAANRRRSPPPPCSWPPTSPPMSTVTPWWSTAACRVRCRSRRGSRARP